MRIIFATILYISTIIASDYRDSSESNATLGDFKNLIIAFLPTTEENPALQSDKIGYKEYIKGRIALFEKDPQSAFKYFKKSCKKGFDLGCVNRGIITLRLTEPSSTQNPKHTKELNKNTSDNFSPSKRVQKALNMLASYCDKKNIFACINLSLYYGHFSSTLRDSIKYAFEACMLGNCKYVPPQAFPIQSHKDYKSFILDACANNDKAACIIAARAYMQSSFSTHKAESSPNLSLPESKIAQEIILKALDYGDRESMQLIAINKHKLRKDLGYKSAFLELLAILNTTPESIAESKKASILQASPPLPPKAQKRLEHLCFTRHHSDSCDMLALFYQNADDTSAMFQAYRHSCMSDFHTNNTSQSCTLFAESTKVSDKIQATLMLAYGCKKANYESCKALLGILPNT